MPDDGAAQFRVAAKALNDAGDKGLRREASAVLRKIARPLGEKVLAAAAPELPKRGGFAAKVAAAKIGVNTTYSGRNPGVAITFRTAAGAEGKSMNLRAVDDGVLRHPTFGRRGKGSWRVTTVPKGSFRRPFDASKEMVAREGVVAMQNVAQEIAVRTNKGGGR